MQVKNMNISAITYARGSKSIELSWCAYDSFIGKGSFAGISPIATPFYPWFLGFSQQQYRKRFTSVA